MPIVQPPAGGGTVPTGTGFRHVTSDEEDSAAKLVENADVHAAAAIAQSKVANLESDLAGKAASAHAHDGLAPTGGTTGQVLKKASNTNYDYAWDTDETSAGGGVTMDEVVDALYPVGAVYVSTLSTNPATLLSRGTWAAFGAGRVLVGHNAGDADFDTSEETGGAKTVASAGAVSQPTFSGNALGTHSHGAGTLVPSAHAGSAVADHGSHTHTYTQVPNHLHPLATGTGATGNFSQVIGTVDTSSGGTGGTPTQTALGTLSGNPSGGVATGTTNGPAAALSHSVTQPSAHTMSGSSEAVSAGTPAGTVTQPTFTGSPTSVVQPYIVVYMWKRTA